VVVAGSVFGEHFVRMKGGVVLFFPVGNSSGPLRNAEMGQVAPHHGTHDDLFVSKNPVQLELVAGKGVDGGGGDEARRGIEEADLGLGSLGVSSIGRVEAGLKGPFEPLSQLALFHLQV